jgi:hypothetical protein
MISKRLSCKEAVELVTEYLEAALLPDMEARFQQHLDSCAGCTLYVDQMRRMLRVLRQLRHDTIAGEEKAALLKLFQDWQIRA